MRQDPFPSRSLQDVLVPDLGAGDEPIRFVTWLVPGASVIPGERIAELLTAGSVFHLEAAAEGVLVDRRAQPGDSVASGAVIARIELTESGSGE